MIQIFFCGLETIFVTRVSPRSNRASPAHVNCSYVLLYLRHSKDKDIFSILHGITIGDFSGVARALFFKWTAGTVRLVTAGTVTVRLVRVKVD